jgi:hydrogenase maturation protease HycI
VLTQTLERLTRADRPLRIAIVGIGHELRGDDAAGVAVACCLQPLVDASDRVFVINAGPAPENITGLLRRFDPSLVLLVDAAQMNQAPGTVHWLDWKDTVGVSASTHTLPPHVLAGYLTAELGCKVALLGIQPSNTCVLGAPLSPEVQRAVDSVVQTLSHTLVVGADISPN